MNKTVLFFTVFFAIFIFSSCSDGENNVTPEKNTGLTVKIPFTTKIFGIGTNPEIAERDSYSTFFAVIRGVQFQYYKGNVKLRLDNTNSYGDLIDELAKAQLIKIDNGFFVYEYPYSGSILEKGPRSPGSANRGTVPLSSSLTLDKPFAFLSRLYSKCLTDYYGLTPEKKSGFLFITNINYNISDNRIMIKANMLLEESAEVNFK